MQTFHAVRAWTDECFEDHRMNAVTHTIWHFYSRVAVRSISRLEKHSSVPERLKTIFPILKNSPVNASHSSKVRHFIKSFKSNNGKPALIHHVASAVRSSLYESHLDRIRPFLIS